ncbi:hypothetical protein ACFS7Z_11415 [Pontibacter toksunensis]|uniref:Outer membrane protein beta-barrel domain-containing protein n=1 Tax=Pontibacter toksunensis TaxID=1332631 RepID=A0ABW6BT67_9BACT
MCTLSKQLLLFCLLFSYKALAQENQPQEPLPQKARHELYAGYDFIPVPVVANTFGDLIGSIISSGGDNKTFVGPVMAGYTYFASDKVGVGIEAGYTTFTSKYSVTGALDYRNKFFVLMPHVTFYWASLERVNFIQELKLVSAISSVILTIIEKKTASMCLLFMLLPLVCV